MLVLKRFSFSSLTSLQIFQLTRYATFIAAGIGFAKMKLPLSEIGQFETFMMVSGMVSFFWVSGTINTTLSVYPKRNEREKRELLFNAFLSLVFLSVVAGVFLLLFSQNVLSFLDKTNGSRLMSMAVIFVLLNCPSFINEYILFLNERRQGLIYYAVFTSLTTILAALVPVWLGYGVEYSLYGLIIVGAVKLVAALFLLRKFSSFILDLKLQTSNFKLSIPLILSIFVSGSAEYIDGLIVKAKFDDVHFAVFRYGAKELPVLLIVANTFSTAMIPVVSDNLNNGLAELKRRSGQLMHIFFPLTIVLMLTSQVIYKLVFSDSFIYSSLIFNIYLLLIIPRVLFPQTILTAIQRNKFLLVSSVLEIIINVSCSVWLAGKIGLPGIAAGTLIAFAFDKIFLVLVNNYVQKIPLSHYLQTGTFCIYSIAACIAFGIGYYMLVKGTMLTFLGWFGI